MVRSANAARVQPGWPPVVVAGAYFTAVALMRRLARRGVKVSCFDCHPGQVGFRTHYGKGRMCPNPEADPEGWLQFMVELAGRIGGKPVLIPSADLFVTAMARHVEQLRPHYVFYDAGAATQALLATKRRQYELADQYGMPSPTTRFVHDEAGAAEFAATARFPCLIKPVHFRHWENLPPGHPLRFQKLVTAGSPEKLIERYRLVAQVNPEVVVQEIIEGPDTAKLVYLSAYGKDGGRLGACVLRQLRTDPVGFGSASIVEPVDDPEADAVCDGFLRRLGYVGLCEIELKRDVRDGAIKLIETNPRYSMTSDAGPYAGVDLGWLSYLDLIGQPVEPVQPSTRPFRHVVVAREVRTVRSQRRAGLLTWREWLGAYRPPIHFFDLDPWDWRVSFTTLTSAARSILGPTLRRVFPKREAART